MKKKPHKSGEIIVINIPAVESQRRMKELIKHALNEIVDIATDENVPVEAVMLDFIGNIIDALQSTRLAQALSEAYKAGIISNHDVYEIAEMSNLRPAFKDSLLLTLRRFVPAPEEEEEEESSPYIG